VLTIRQALEHEYAEIGKLTADAYTPVLTFGAADPYRPTLMDAAGRAAEAELWVAVDHRSIAGTVTVCRPGGPYAEIAAPSELEVRMLAVSPDRQGQGIGSSLMAAVHETAATEAFESVVLSVISSNTGATAFYQRLGYVHDATRDWQPVPSITLQVWRRQLD
jgi:ribosomal protein S18 acetylase RimI-like enzyme